VGVKATIDDVETSPPRSLIARLWHGWATGENAKHYEALLRSEVLPRIHRIEGYRGAYLLRKPTAEGVEFVTMTLWDSVDALRAFAGEDFEAAVVPPEARRLLSRFDERAVHYEIVIEPPATGSTSSFPR
jgi:heme-degrading monooxygenase HmoA